MGVIQTRQIQIAGLSNEIRKRGNAWLKLCIAQGNDLIQLKKSLPKGQYDLACKQLAIPKTVAIRYSSLARGAQERPELLTANGVNDGLRYLSQCQAETTKAEDREKAREPRSWPANIAALACCARFAKSFERVPVDAWNPAQLKRIGDLLAKVKAKLWPT